MRGLAPQGSHVVINRRRGMYRGKPAKSSHQTWRGKGKLRIHHKNKQELVQQPKPENKILRFKNFPPLSEAEDIEIPPDWISGPCSLSGCSKPTAKGNFDALIDMMMDTDPAGDDWDTALWDHFSEGWLEVVFVRPESACASMCEAARELIATGAVLNTAYVEAYQAEEAEKAKAAKEGKDAETKKYEDGFMSGQPFTDSFGIKWHKNNDGCWIRDDWEKDKCQTSK